jgi:2',3'-cyclic-nucleotide 2'-phosphodiesterase/3'-nucleotidase
MQTRKLCIKGALQINKLKRYFCFSVLLLLLLPALASSRTDEIFSTQDNQNQEPSPEGEIVRLKIIGMADLHGNFIAYDHIRRRPAVGGLPFVRQFAVDQRKDTTQHVILLNGGDVLQGSMQAYYYNYVDHRENYMPAIFFNRAGVDVSVVGNHDLEVGIEILDRFAKELNSPLLGANVVYKGTQNPFFKPYTILERDGVRIAVLGLTMPIQNECVTVEIIEGKEVINMYEPARYWMNHIKTYESPDLIIGLFHAGFPYGADSLQVGQKCFLENNTIYIAQNIPGFDAIVLGHLHQTVVARVANTEGDSVWLVEPGYGGKDVAILNFELQKRPEQKAKILRSSAEVQNVSTSRDYLSQETLDIIAKESILMTLISDDPIARLLDTICNVKAYFGPSSFVDMIHKVQLERTGAEVSFASPLSTNVVIPPGPITFSDLFRIYRFENTLTVLYMSGKEIKNYLEFSYGLWINQMLSQEDRLLRTKENTPGSVAFLGRQFEIPQYYFDNAAGLDYEIDVTKPFGERIQILRMSNNESFCENRMYKVVTTAYRVAGAGGHMELGAGISRHEIPNRIISNDNIMIRELIRREFIRQGEVMPFDFYFNNWKFVPEEFVKQAKEREFNELLER